MHTPPPKRGGQEPPGRRHGIAADIPVASQHDVIATDLPADGQSLAFPMNAGVYAETPIASATDDEQERRLRLLLFDESSTLRPTEYVQLAAASGREATAARPGIRGSRDR